MNRARNYAKVYIVYHCHSDYSNTNGFADSSTKFTEYIKLAKKNGMKAIAFSEHGNIADWIKKKQACDKAGIKYIHGIELYLCNKLEEDDRGSHIGLYARNWDGVLELNKLISISTSKGKLNDNSDRHAYYNPRISLEELMNTSENIIVTTACLASPLRKWNVSERENEWKKLIAWLTKNKHRCFLEIQYHNHKDQIEYNKKLHFISMKTGIPLIAGTDTHSSSEYKAECRKILQKSKDSFYGDEDAFDLTWKTYDELVECFRIQNALEPDVYLQAIENTNVLADMVEDFKLDKSFKYPTIYGDNVKEQWQKLISKKLNEKIKCKAIDVSKLKEYQTQIYEEFDVMSTLGMESFMMFMSELNCWCKDNGIPVGFGRGSVAGSTIAFITDITDVDPVVWKTVFSRFCNIDRISLGDIDSDYSPEDRAKVYEYIVNRFTPQKTAYIASFSTLKDRGCIDVLAKGLEYKDLDKVMDIKNQFDELFNAYGKIMQEEVNSEELVENGEIESSAVDFDNHNVYISHINNNIDRHKAESIKRDYEQLKENNRDLFYYMDGLKGTIIAKGIHPSGMIGAPITVADNIGLFYKDGDENMPVSSCAMKAVDSLNWVKFDILGLKTVGIIKDTCEYVGIPYPKSHEINWEDEKVWTNMITAQQGVFQFEGDFAFRLLSDFQPHTINHMSIVNASLRPSGKSYRDRLIAGEFNNNPSEEIDSLLADNNGFLIFQEDTIKFLTDICDFSGSSADTTRRAIGKKDKELLSQQLPKILEGYCKHSPKPREIAEKEAKQFVQIIADSSEYQFGYNHSTAYSMNGYLCTMLRTYYPLEFTTAYLNRAEDAKDINNGVELAKINNIEIMPISFGKSRGKYTFNKSENSIYKGISSIKYCNEQIADELYIMANEKKYDNFIDILIDISEKTSVNSRQLKILTTLGFFDRFGKNKKLLDTIDMYNNIGTKKQIKMSDINILGINLPLLEKYSGKKTEKLYKELDMISYVKEASKSILDKSLSIQEQIKCELEYLEYVVYTNPSLPSDTYIVFEYKTYKDTTKPYVTVHNLSTGEDIKTKVTAGTAFSRNPFQKFSVLRIDFREQFKSKYINGEYKKTDEIELIMKEWEVMQF